MFATIRRTRDAQQALTATALRIKALRLREVEPKQVPVQFNAEAFWQQLSADHGHGVMFARLSYKRVDECGLACHWEEGAMMHPHVHPDTDEMIYMIRGALVDLYTGATIRPGEMTSAEDVLNGSAHVQPFVIPAGTAHFLQALEPDTHFVIKFKRNANNDQGQ
jgi:uncharacterized protein YjlB